MRLMRFKSNQGFTILELLIASAVFTVVLLVVAAGVVSFTNTYYKGIANSKTQATARSIAAQLTQAIQFGKSVTTLSAGGGVNGVCIDNSLYSYAVGQQVTDSAPNAALHQGYHGLVVSSGTDCSASVPTVPTAANLPTRSRELLGPHMRLGALSVTASGGLYAVSVVVIYGDDDLLTPTLGANPAWAIEQCAGRDGSQFCAVSSLSTTVQPRLM